MAWNPFVVRFCTLALVLPLAACTGRRRGGNPDSGPPDAGLHDAGDGGPGMDGGGIDFGSGDFGVDFGGTDGSTDGSRPDLGHFDLGPTGLYHGWPSPIAGCLTTGYDSIAPTALGGNYPYNAGDSNACRAWKLAATVCTTQPTEYNGTTDNWTCPASGGFTDPIFGMFCMSPTTQYACSTCPGSCNATCIYMPLSLRDCTGTEVSQM